MPYNSVAEIYESLDESRERLRASVDGLSDPQVSFRTGPERWSVAEILEHVSLVERQLARLFHVMVAKAEAARIDGQERVPFIPVSIDHLVEPLKTQRLDAPQNARPTGAVSPADSFARLSQSRAALHALRPRIEQVDGASVRYPHPAAGPIDIYQWLLFVGAHEDRHCNQIEALKQSPGF